MADELNRRTRKCTSKAVTGTTATLWTMLKSGYFDSLLGKLARDYLSVCQAIKFPIMSSRMVGFRSDSSREFRSSRHSQAIGRLGYPLGWVNLSIQSFKDRRKRAKKNSLLPWLFNGLLQPAFCTPRLVYCCCSVYLLFLLKGKYLQIADLKNGGLMSKRALGLRSFAKRMVTINNRF